VYDTDSYAASDEGLASRQGGTHVGVVGVSVDGVEFGFLVEPAEYGARLEVAGVDDSVGFGNG